VGAGRHAGLAWHVRARLRRREVDLHVQPAARPQLDLQASVMSHGNRADDGQPEPVAVRVTGLAIAESLERLEELFDGVVERNQARVQAGALQE